MTFLKFQTWCLGEKKKEKKKKQSLGDGCRSVYVLLSDEV